jgi:hypothetical protein
VAAFYLADGGEMQAHAVSELLLCHSRCFATFAKVSPEGDAHDATLSTGSCAGLSARMGSRSII